MKAAISPSDLDTMTVRAIMTQWPQTVAVFVTWRLHCVGCPIADFHTIADAAREHGYQPAALERALRLAIEAGRINPTGPPRRRRRSATDDAGP